MKTYTEEDIETDIEEFNKLHGDSLWKTGMMTFPDGLSEYEQAKFYVLTHGSRHGLAYECLKSFYDFNAAQETPSNDDYWRNAHDALYEWDI